MFVFVVMAVTATLTNGVYVHECGTLNKKTGTLDCKNEGLTTIPQIDSGVVRV